MIWASSENGDRAAAVVFTRPPSREAMGEQRLGQPAPHTGYGRQRRQGARHDAERMQDAGASGAFRAHAAAEPRHVRRQPGRRHDHGHVRREKVAIKGSTFMSQPSGDVASQGTGGA